MNGMKQFNEAMHKVSAMPPWQSGKLKQHQRWNPYSQEGGTSASIAGDDFVVAASDTRISQMDINILSRNMKKTYILSDKIILSTSGFQGDVLQLKRILETNLHKYRFDRKEDMSVDMCAQMLARILYRRRFFPLYTCAILSGIDDFGKGAVYSYDPVGCVERVSTQCSGDGEPLLQPLFDNQARFATLAPGIERPTLTVERAISLIKDGFRFIAEREISTGDSIYIVVAQAGKPVQSMTFPLRGD